MPFPILAALAAAQIIQGIAKGKKSADDAKRLTASRQPYQTSQPVYDILNASENRAQQGYDAGTLEYLTNQIDRAGSSAYGTAKRLGANPNDLSALFDQQLQATMKVGAENNALNMENFSKYLGAQELLSKNLDAEWASKQGMIKDQLQSADERRKEASATISNGINTGISAYSNDQIMKLYRDQINNNANHQPVINYPQGSFTTRGNTVDVSTNLPVDLTSQSQTVSNVVTPAYSQPRRQGSRIIGIDSNGDFIYGR